MHNPAHGIFIQARIIPGPQEAIGPELRAV
jgi:hypothetical protein